MDTRGISGPSLHTGSTTGSTKVPPTADPRTMVYVSEGITSVASPAFAVCEWMRKRELQLDPNAVSATPPGTPESEKAMNAGKRIPEYGKKAVEA